MFALTDSITPVTMDSIEGPEGSGKRRLMAAGERLLGERGFAGISLQDIATAAGNANKSAINYHFGGKDGLIKAILTLRLRWIDRRRQSLIDRAAEKGLLSNMAALLEALYLPVAEQVDEHGRHSYARFWLQYYARPDYDRFADPLFDLAGGPTETVIGHIVRLMGIDPEAASERLFLHSFVALAALVDRDNRRAHGHSVPGLDVTLGRAIESVAAGLTAVRC